jgi:hypothetical protein
MDEFRKWASVHNLSRIVHFHNDLRGCLRHALASSETARSTDNSLLQEKIDDYDSLLRVNTFLMLYSHTEEWLNLLSKKYYPQFPIDDGGSITRYRNVVCNGFGIDISRGQWQLLTDCEKIRNCLLHANGRVDLMKNEQEIRQVAKRLGADIKLGKLNISSNFLACFSKEVEGLVNDLQNRA